MTDPHLSIMILAINTVTVGNMEKCERPTLNDEYKNFVIAQIEAAAECNTN